MYDDILEKEIVKLSNEEKSQVEWRLEIKYLLKIYFSCLNFLLLLCFIRTKFCQKKETCFTLKNNEKYTRLI
jgi:hypothetical protein